MNKLNQKTILAIDGFFIIACYNITIDCSLLAKKKDLKTEQLTWG